MKIPHDSMEQFTALVKTERYGQRLKIECPLGLWVACDYSEHAIRDALSYFQQYKQDGEYDALIEEMK